MKRENKNNNKNEVHHQWSWHISYELRDFFNKDINNHIEFWNYLSNKNWPLHSAVDKDSKSFDLSLSFSCKSFWNFCKKYNCNSILLQWRMSFQVSEYKGKKLSQTLRWWIQSSWTINHQGQSLVSTLWSFKYTMC